MAKGHSGESCREAIRKCIKPGEVLSFSELYNKVRQLGAWKDETVWQQLIAVIVNLPPARFHWKSVQPFLFIRGDGRYENYDSKIHPQIID